MNSRILRIAVPAIISNITVPLLGLVDVAIVGHLGATSYIGAIAVGGMIFNVMYWLFGFLRMGTSGLTSQALGRRDLDGVASILMRSLGLAVGLAALLVILQVPLCALALAVMSPTPEVGRLAETYFNILIWGAPAMLSLYSITGWYIGMQNSRLPMVVAIAQNVVNIAASLFFVFAMGMKVEGVALGTLTAQYSGLLIAAAAWIASYGRLRRRFRVGHLLAWQEMRRYLSVNRDIFLRTLCLISVMLFFTSAGSWQGDTILAVNTLLMQFYMLFSYVMDGFAYAGEALGGRYYGARNEKALSHMLRSLFLWGGAMTLLFTLLYIIGGRAFLHVLTDDAAVIAASAAYYPWAVLMPVAGAAAFIWDGVFIGCTKTGGMLLSMLMATAVFFVLFFSLRPLLGNHGLWLAFVAYMLARGLAQTLIWRSAKKIAGNHK